MAKVPSLVSKVAAPPLDGALELLATLLELGGMLLELGATLLELAIELLLGAMLLELIGADEMATELELCCCGALLLDGVGLPVQAANAATDVASRMPLDRRRAERRCVIIVIPCWFIVMCIRPKLRRKHYDTTKALYNFRTTLQK